MSKHDVPMNWRTVRDMLANKSMSQTCLRFTAQEWLLWGKVVKQTVIDEKFAPVYARYEDVLRGKICDLLYKFARLHGADEETATVINRIVS